MSYNLLLLCVVVALFYSTTLVNGNCHDDESSTLPTPTSTVSDIKTTILPSPSPLNKEKECPLPRSCKDWYDLNITKSCKYPIYPDGKTQKIVYCNMKGTHCDGIGGWTRVAYLNMTESGATCPPGLSVEQYNNIDHDLCGLHSSFVSAGCSSTTFSALGLNYLEVCGQIRGYQNEGPDAFSRLYKGIDSYYVDGVSITYGQNPRTHIWTYAGGLREDKINQNACPCNTDYSGGRNVASSFVGNHYYCESGLDPGKHWTPVLHANDPLWDGKNCDSNEVPCCTNSKMPWFYRVLDDITQDDIELRMCNQHSAFAGHTPLDIIELYVR